MPIKDHLKSGRRQCHRTGLSSILCCSPSQPEEPRDNSPPKRAARSYGEGAPEFARPAMSPILGRFQSKRPDQSFSPLQLTGGKESPAVPQAPESTEQRPPGPHRTQPRNPSHVSTSAAAQPHEQGELL